MIQQWFLLKFCWRFFIPRFFVLAIEFPNRHINTFLHKMPNNFFHDWDICFYIFAFYICIWYSQNVGMFEKGKEKILSMGSNTLVRLIPWGIIPLAHSMFSLFLFFHNYFFYNKTTFDVKCSHHLMFLHHLQSFFGWFIASKGKRKRLLWLFE